MSTNIASDVLETREGDPVSEAPNGHPKHLQTGPPSSHNTINKLRLTGGEPLIRRNILCLIEKLGVLEGLQELTLTTNGSQLTKYASELARLGVQRINISLDSLDPIKFKQITRTGNLEQVIEGIDAARTAGFKQIKLNSVIMKQRNDEEILDTRVGYRNRYANSCCTRTNNNDIVHLFEIISCIP